MGANACRYGELSSPEADPSLRPPLAPPARSRLEGLLWVNQGYGDMKVDACDAACSMDRQFPLEFLYICIIVAHSGCA